MSAREYVSVPSIHHVSVAVCGDCGGLVNNVDEHDRWHDDLVEGFKARDHEFQRLVDVVCGKPPRRPYRRPQTPEEREQMEQIMRELGLRKD
ncbi:hypothetical protein QNA24_29890 [Rhodococcus qingshengii]|uniref:hypothetical protein n=1 Tax=Rhodococcus TaxID=1827 RepID=UPI001E51D7F9|nr:MULTISPECIES: hypothetical protein [Rhodococcus]MCD2099583.1 hypothetical protein [Rhodococcus rhodochrous]MCD2123951.1 hypothetical protein [Rhodococcus rhodochrous]MCQ4136620.1 hypothetical protein [Rhodococcus rhodochrous]MDJ0490595.1 hypothetical protein [Rhodococcus qingshengii]